MKFIKLSAILYFLIILSSCLTVKNTEYSPEIKSENSKKICILYHHSDFRKKVIDELIKKFNLLNCQVVVDSAVKIKNHAPEKYDLVIIFSGIHAFILDGYPRHYIFIHKKKKNIIHVFLTFLTKKGIKLKLDNPKKVDTITAASVKQNKNDLIENIYNLSMKKLGLGNL